MSKMFRISYPVLFLWILAACHPESARQDVDMSGVEVPEVHIKRYGARIFSLDTANLQAELKQFKPIYPLFLNGDLDDPGTVERMREFITDPKLIAANRDCQKIFPDLGWLEVELTDLFRHYTYYFPDDLLPVVYTYVSGFDYEFRTQYYNHNLIIALDMYLGPDYPAYQQLGVPQYVIRKFDGRYIPRDCAFEMGRGKINMQKPGNDLLHFMISEGKLLYFVKSMVPDIDRAVLFDYTEEQLNWVDRFEGMVWAFIIENEALYSSNPEFRQKFILEGPFTSYFGNESPPRLGAYVGYRIVDRYMERNPDIELSQLMDQSDPQRILKESKYKPDY